MQKSCTTLAQRLQGQSAKIVKSPNRKQTHMPFSHRLLAAALIGCSGLSVMLAMGWPYWTGDWPFLLAAGASAAVLGYGFADCFGQPGRHGLGLGLIGALLTTLCGAALAGFGLGLVMGPTLAGAIFGPMAVGQALLTSPAALVTWIVSMALAHLLMGQVRSRHLMPS
jgi:hypothetical protein